MELKVGDKFDITYEVKEVSGSFVKVVSRYSEYGFLKDTLRDLDTKELPEVPRVAIKFYREYKNDLTSFEEWFSDFYDSSFLKDFPEGAKLAQWLYDNDTETNLKRELALATLIVNGEDSVRVIQTEQEYIVYLMYVDQDYSMLHKNLDTGKFFFGNQTNLHNHKSMFTLKELEELGFSGALNNPLLKVELAF